MCQAFLPTHTHIKCSCSNSSNPPIHPPSSTYHIELLGKECALRIDVIRAVYVVQCVQDGRHAQFYRMGGWVGGWVEIVAGATTD